MAKAPAFQFYASDFLTDTQAWEIEEIGIYIRLLSNQWVNGPLPKDEKRLARIAGCDTDIFKKAWVILGFKFSINSEDLLYNPKLEEIRDEQEAFRVKQRLNGSKGGRPPKKETQTKPKQNPTVNPNHNPNHNPNETSSSSPSIYINKEEERPFFYIAGQLIQSKPSERIISDHSYATDSFMMSIFRGLDKTKILEQLDIDYAAYQFNDEMHLRNSFKSVGEKMLNALKPKTNFFKKEVPEVPSPAGFVIGQKAPKGVGHGK